ncbi:MAG: 2-phosphosulfolactate phosphatase [Bacteroidales bacterium]|nr:2-phosphosulfolactate phosphatase [Bacteroidales bacterium]
MQVEVILSPLLYDGRQLKENHVVVAVDVLRATTAICAAFKAGAEEVVPLNSLDPLPDFFRKGYSVAAERNAQKVVVEGIPATCGNSPSEYLSQDLTGQRLAYSTTNGTVSILKGKDCDKLYVGSFANLSALAERLRDETRIVVLCSGWKGDPCIEDTLFAGALCGLLQRRLGADLVNDAALYSVDLWNLAKDDLYAFCSKATHVHRLQKMNYDNDVRLAFRLDTCPVVPTLIDRNNIPTLVIDE